MIQNKLNGIERTGVISSSFTKEYTEHHTYYIHIFKEIYDRPIWFLAWKAKVYVYF